MALVISELFDYKNKPKQHFSFCKGFLFADSLSKIIKTFYVTTGISEKLSNIDLINIDEINNEFLDDIKFLIFIREGNLSEILERNINIKNLMFNKKRKQKICNKGDTIKWVFCKETNQNFIEKYNINFIDFVTETFDIICCQTQEYKKFILKRIKKKHNKYYEIFKKILFLSRMGIPNKNPLDDTIINPYDINHNYCKEKCTELKNENALHPLVKIPKEQYNKKKFNLLFMGRIKTDGGKISLLMNDIMKKLGDDYELHIFPGRFVLPNNPNVILSSKNFSSLSTLQNSVFQDSTNIIIHTPYDDTTKTKYLQNIDIAIDFSSSRPINTKSMNGHAKLLEYCYYGLKVVAERNINNSHLVTSGQNGILLDGIGTVDDYVKAIKIMSNKTIDRTYCIESTIKSSNWDSISKELYDALAK